MCSKWYFRQVRILGKPRKVTVSVVLAANNGPCGVITAAMLHEYFTAPSTPLILWTLGFHLGLILSASTGPAEPRTL